MIKSYYLIKIIEQALLCRFDHPEFWKTIIETLLNNVSYEQASDIIDILTAVKNYPEIFDSKFSEQMIEKIPTTLMSSFSVKDLIALCALYKEKKKTSLVNSII